ncbi:MAG: hypothetical protein PHX47_02565 [Candidatus ainarchaeum sp.]|jgi:hypothetical protein|nr:hypothetical protein [Candidatus ainarchaeum sp.]
MTNTNELTKKELKEEERHDKMFLCECGEYTNKPRFSLNPFGECKVCFKSSLYLKRMKDFLK